MIVVLKPEATDLQTEQVIAKITEAGLTPHVMKGVERVVIAVIGDERVLGPDILSAMSGVQDVMPILSPYKLVSREFQKENTVIDIQGVRIGERRVVVMAGPCSVETKERLFSIAEDVKMAGALILRGGAFKPRTSPYSFQG
ncbi:MAG: 3-deoxy-7-phosphoheptulonate synthase, partial [Nitrospirae bacterium]|nr:3-deoxy-7-phosphoheptulonate synthase [Candidatus Troglogloeales bacterium]